MIEGRALIGSLAGSRVVAPLAAEAQPAAQVPRIGFLWGGTPTPSLLREFEDALRDRGGVSGRTTTIEHRAAEGRAERLPQLAGELVADGLRDLGHSVAAPCGWGRRS
jgi:hypothetical protein